jgi:GGDEF domain-containing protein
MSVISIKRLLSSEAQSPGHPLRVAQILVKGMGTNAVEGDPDEFRAFRKAMEEAAEALGRAVTEAAALVTVSGALKSLEEHNRNAEDYLHAGGNDLRAMVKMLTAAIGEFAAAGDQNLKCLRLIENRVVTANQSQDVRAIKSHLGACLREIRKEAERQKADTQSAVSRMQSDLERARTEGVDPATGLPPHGKAVEWIGEICRTQAPAFAACLAIDRLQSVNTTFGSEVGEEILRYFTAHVQRNLTENDRLFRWTGACLLAVAPREGDLQAVRKEFAKLMEQKLEYTIETATRSILLPVQVRWAIFPFQESAGPLIAQIDAFASAGSGPGAPYAA